MKSFVIYVLLVFCYILNIMCNNDLSSIFQIIYRSMKKLPKGSSIYFSENGKCSKDEYSPIFCLVEKSLYKVDEKNYTWILDLNEYNQSYFYELNIINKTYSNSNLSCIITYINQLKEIRFLYYIIDEKFHSNFFKQHSFNIINPLPINHYINCHGVVTSQLNCYFIDTSRMIQWRVLYIRHSI